jgi:sugar phosphate permease
MHDDINRTLRYRWLIFAVLGLQYLIVYFHRVAPAVVAEDLIDTFSISGTSLGILASTYFYSYAVMQIPIGMLSDSWGPRKTITLFSFITALGAISFGLSPGFNMAVISRLLVGLGVSAIFVATMKVFALWFRPLEYGRIASVFMALGGIGWFIATTPLAVFSHRFGWRASFILIGFICAMLTLFTWFIVADRPERKGFAPIAESGAASGIARRNILKDLGLTLRERHFWAIAIWFVFRGGALFGFFGLWAGPYLTDVYKLPMDTKGGILSMIAFAMIFMSPLLGHLSDKTLQSRKQVLVGTSLLNTLCFLVMALWFDVLSIPALYVLFFLMGITISSVGTLAITATKEFFPLEMAGTAIGIMNVFPFIGGISFQPLMGYVLDKAGKVGGAYSPSAYQFIIWIYFATSVLALVSILFCRETLPGRDRKKTGPRQA